MKKPKMHIGWREWVSLPELGIPAIKVKVDTGARTSALHAFNIKETEKDGQKYATFEIHPIQGDDKHIRKCIAPLVDKRHIKSSIGKKQHRHVIETRINLGEKSWSAEITLTNRDEMGYRMLLGRKAMKKLIIEPSKSFCCGRLDDEQLEQLYT